MTARGEAADRPVAELRRRVADNVRLIRRRAGWSQSDLAREAGVTKPHITKIETMRVSVNLSTLARLARALWVEPAELLVPPYETRFYTTCNVAVRVPAQHAPPQWLDRIKE